ncbi:MAG: DNA-binding protein [Bacteroidetes bacterium HGW-Bacteroidetes-11]|jgi:predicted histone-like DNA-binding protein|nr:MAG: DNA-binding protein [Bacteroidetes bacterium HGW-Bacteroidetes-11]
MSVQYVIIERGNPLNMASPKKFYAMAKSTGVVSLKQLSKDISARSTVNSSDTLAVLDSLVQQLTKELEEGRIVRLGDFGSFQLSLSSEGADTADKFNSSMVKKSKILFRPGIDLRNMLATVTYSKEK